MTEAAAPLLDGGNSSLPNDVGEASEYTGKLNMLLGVVPHADYHAKHTPGERRMLSPAPDQWWTYLNDEFRKTNCSAIKFDAAGFDLEATRFDLDDCLRTPRSDPRQAHRLFLNNTMRGGGGHYDADANLDTAPEPFDAIYRLSFAANHTTMDQHASGSSLGVSDNKHQKNNIC